MSRFMSRRAAVVGLSNAYWSKLESLPTLAERREWLRHQIDLAWLPDAVARKVETSDRAWHLFLNDILRAAGLA